MAHKVGRAISQTRWKDIGTGKNWDRFTTGLRGTGEDFSNMASDAWDALSGQVDPNSLEYIDWQQQQYNPSWNLDAQTGTAQGYTAQGYTGQGYDATQLGSAQGYTGQGYTGQGYDAMIGDYQTGQQFQDILGQAMGAADQFMDPSSQWARGQQSILAETTGQQMGQAQAQQSAQLAARGMGGGGLRSILGSQAQAQAGAAQRQGQTDIATAGAGLGLQALGQAGTMVTSQEQNLLQQSLANQAAMNQASQFGASAQNQAAQFSAAAQNQANQFTAGQQNQFSLANQQAQNAASAFGAQAANTANQWSAGQTNLANQWSAGQQNQMSQFNAQQRQAQNQYNTGNQMNWQSWNASQDFAADQFNASQRNAIYLGNAANQSAAIGGAIQTGGVAVAKIALMCIPEGTKIDTPDGSIPIEDLKSGDIVNGYGSKPVAITQKHEYKENPEPKRFLKIYFDDGDTIDLCDMHRIKGVRSREYNVGDSINGKQIINIKWYNGVTRSYDLLTEDKGYRISGVPVDSMIEEMNTMISLLKEVK